MYTKGSKRPLRTDAKYSQDDTNAAEYAEGNDLFDADEKAWSEAQLDTSKAKVVSGLAFKAPATSSLRGEIVNVSGPIESKRKQGSFFRIITLEDWTTGATYQRPLSNNLYEGSNGGSGLKNNLLEGKFVELEITHQIADVTEYVDRDGEVVKHTSTSDIISGAKSISAAKYQMVFKAGLYQQA